MPSEPLRAPLQGLGVVVTRDEGEDGRLTASLEARGATVLHWPTVRVAPPEDSGPLEAAVRRLDRYDWIVFTSRRAVAALEPEGRPGRGLRVGVVGRSTAEAARAAGWRVDIVPETETGEGLVAAMAAAGVGTGDRVLFPASAIASDTVPEGLRSLGADVDRVTAYRTVEARPDQEACRRALDAGRVRVVTVTSPSAVRGLAGALGETLFGRVASEAVFAAIGPVTGDAARTAGVARVIEAADSSFEGLADRVVAWSRTEAERGAQ